MGVVHIFMVYSPLLSIYYIPIAQPTIVSTNIQITNRAKALKGFSMWGICFDYCGTNIWQHIHTAKKKKGNYCSPSSVITGSSVKASSSVGPLIVSEGEELQLPHCSHLHSLLYVLCVV